jgi:hypothetical protein
MVMSTNHDEYYKQPTLMSNNDNRVIGHGGG